MMNKHKLVGTVLALILVFGLLSPLAAQDLSVLSLAGQSEVDGRSWLMYNGPGGLRILTLAPYPEDAGRRLETAVSVVADWSTIRVTELRAESSKDVDDYVLTFSSIISEGRDYSDNVPGGLRLRYDGALMYDFRVRSGEYFVRVRGVLMDETALIAEIVRAVNDPGGYIAERDPAWLALRIEQLDSALTATNEKLAQETDRTRALEDLVRATTARGEALIETRTAEFQALMDAMTLEAGQVRQALESELEANTEALRLALASEMNKGLFGGPKPLDQAVFEHVLAAKREKAGADRTMVLESAKAAGLKPRSKEIDIIFRVWFGE